MNFHKRGSRVAVVIDGLLFVCAQSEDYEVDQTVLDVYGSAAKPEPNFTGKMKIFLGFLQIATNIGTGLEIQWPPSFKSMILMVCSVVVRIKEPAFCLTSGGMGNRSTSQTQTSFSRTSPALNVWRTCLITGSSCS